MTDSCPPLGEQLRRQVDFRDGHPLEQAEARWRPSWQGEGCDFPIPRPAATAGSLVSDIRFPLAGLVSSFPRSVGGGDLPDSVGLLDDFPSSRHTVIAPFKLHFLHHPDSSIIQVLFWNRSHSSTWLLTQRTETVMLATSHQHWHPSSPAFLKQRPK